MARLEEISEQHKQKRINSQSQLDASAQVNSDSAANGETPPIADIFAILQDHSKVLDKVLSGCMLRTQQRAISDVVDDILNTILRFGTLIRDLRRRAMKEEVAANQLGKLHTNFERKMIAFVCAFSTYNRSFVTDETYSSILSFIIFTMTIQ